MTPISKIVSFAIAIASRGINNKKINDNIKKLRYISCYGHKNIEACPKLKKSDKSNFYYCGGCGCGDKPHTWLIREPGVYSKLDYPRLTCPLKMPGFDNYDPNSPEDGLNRKKQIETINTEDFKFIELTVSIDAQKEKIFEELNKIIPNS